MMPNRKTFSGAGRKKAAPRYPSGQIVHRHRTPRETEEQVLATALAQPHRKPASEPRSPLLGYALGRLKYAKLVTAEQHTAGEQFARVAIRYFSRVVNHLPKFPSLMADRIARETGDGREVDADEAATCSRAYADAISALAMTGEAEDCQRALVAVCLLDREPDNSQLGSLRVALNALHRLWTTEKQA